MKSTKLKNWIDLIIKNVPWAKSLTCLVLVWAWSRYEHTENRWISHFLEHMFFKWAKKYKNAREVSTAIDSIWWDFNAFTWKEYAGYYVKCASRHAQVAFDVLSDMLTFPTFEQAEIDKEKLVILEEINMYLDMPKYQIAWEFEQLIIWDQPLWWDQLWTKKFINSVTQADFQKQRDALYTPDNIVITLTWDIEAEDWNKWAEKYFSNLSWKKEFNWSKLKEKDSEDRIRIINKQTEQSHIIVWVKWSPWKDLDNFWTQKLLSTMLWWMMSSRMFLNIREEKWLCYYIGTHTDDYTDFWVFSTSAWVDNNRVDMAIEAIIKEYKNIVTEKISEEELQKSKNFLIWKTLLSLEDTESLAHMYGKQQLLLWKIITEDEIIKNIEKVSVDDIFNHAKLILWSWKIYIAGIWPLSDKQTIWEWFLNKS